MTKSTEEGQNWWVWNIKDQTDELKEHKGPFVTMLPPSISMYMFPCAPLTWSCNWLVKKIGPMSCQTTKIVCLFGLMHVFMCDHIGSCCNSFWNLPMYLLNSLIVQVLSQICVSYIIEFMLNGLTIICMMYFHPKSLS